MYSLFAYIIQVNILLTIVYVGYYLLLRKLTFYRLNRGFFLIGIVFSFVYPFLNIKSLFYTHMKPVGEWMGYLPDFYTQQVEKSVYTLENAIYSGMAAVGLWFAIRLCIQLLSLLRIHIYSNRTLWKTYWYQNVLFPIVPFSFLNRIYLHKEQHQEPELHDIFEHEDIHVKGLHSLDILMFEILLIICWYNPFVWLMRRTVRQNLEYLTDQQVLNKGVDRQTYQYSLLNVSKQGASLGVSSQFNFKFLKKRIMMMNKKKSSKLELSKYAFLLPIVVFSAGAFTISKADGKITETAEVAREMEVEEIKGLLQKQDTIKPTFDVKSEETTLPAAKDDQMTIEGPMSGVARSGKKQGFSRKAVEGKVTGVRVDRKQNLSDTTEHSKIVFGNSKMGGKPLFVIDGVEQPENMTIDKLNPDQIESIDVLKDEPATAAYGDKGKNGVIMITTKTKDATRVWASSTKLPEPLRNPIYMVDGQVVSKEAYSKIKESEKKSIATLSKEDAKNYLKFYRNIDLGEHDGLVLIGTK